MKLKATTNVRQYINSTLKEQKKRVGRAAVIANRRAAAVGATEFKEEVKQKYSLKAGAINKNIKIKYGNYNDPSAKLIGTGKGISLKQFNVRPTRYISQKGIQIERRRDVSVEVIKGNRTTIHSAFLVKLGKDSFGVFKRLKGEKKKITKLFGPGISLLLAMEKNQKLIREKIKGKYDKYYEQAYKYANK